MLFDDDEQLEVRHVVSLAHYDVSIYSGGDETPEGELFIKRNALCLSRRKDHTSVATPDKQSSKPFFLFSENCSDKEDFYFALLRSQEKQPKPLQYEMKDIITLVQKIHSSEENLQTRWINAIMGRVFLALYKTSDIKNFLRAKIKKKISRVKTPGFLSKIALQNIYMGDSAPIITNPKLRDLTVNGEVIIEADVRYSGNFRIEVAAAARIDLGARFKAREVNLVLAVDLKRVDGHMLLKIKPPPSNRFWVCFQSQPRIDMSIEPIVSSRQITYTLILRQIEKRIKEVVAESLVFPNWDDSPFFATEKKSRRGGIWADDIEADEKDQKEIDKSAIIEPESLEEKDVVETSNSGENVIKIEREDSGPSPDADTSIPKTSTSPQNKTSNQNPSPVFNFPADKMVDSSHTLDTQSHIEKSSNSFRPGSFPISSSPIVGTDSTTADAFKVTHKADHSHAIAAFSALSQINSPSSFSGSNPHISKSEKQKSDSFIPSLDSCLEKKTQSDTFETYSSVASTSKNVKLPFFSSNTGYTSNTLDKQETISSRSADTGLQKDNPSSSPGQTSTTEFKRLSIATMNNAAATAKKWSLIAFQRNIDQKNDSIPENGLSGSLVMGRGQPLPPPGVPLPPPSKKTRTAPIPVPKRRIPSVDTSEKFIPNKISTSTENTPLQALSLPSTTVKRSYERSSVMIESTNDSLLSAPMSHTNLEKALTEDEQSIAIPRINFSRNDSDKQKITGNLGKNGKIGHTKTNMTNTTRSKSEMNSVDTEYINS